MQTSNRLFDDLAKVASGAMHTLGGLREEVETRVRERLERVLADMDLVTREEFDAVRAMAAKARSEQEDLAAKVAGLQTELAGLRAARDGTDVAGADAAGVAAAATTAAAEEPVGVTEEPAEATAKPKRRRAPTKRPDDEGDDGVGTPS